MHQATSLPRIKPIVFPKMLVIVSIVIHIRKLTIKISQSITSILRGSKTLPAVHRIECTRTVNKIKLPLILILIILF